MNMIVLSRSDLAAIARSNLGGDFSDLHDISFVFDQRGEIVDCFGTTTSRKQSDHAGPSLAYAADVALQRWQRRGQECKVIEFKRSNQ